MSADDLPLTFEAFTAFVARGAHAQAVIDHLAYHGVGLTFGELAIGDAFGWAPARGVAFPRGPSPIVKDSPTTYWFWIHGVVGGRKATGTAEAYYRVERW